MKKQIAIGTRVHSLIVIKYLGSINYNNTYLCKCDCGKERNVKLTYLLNSSVTNCGCRNFINKKHGNSKYNPQEASFRAKATNYKGLAKIRKIEFLLSIDHTIKLLKQSCNYCGKSPANKYNVRISNRLNKKNTINYSYQNSSGYEILYNGIDRVDNTKGYTLDNTVSCCTQCNTAKLNFTLVEFKEWITNVYLKTIKNENLDN